MLVYSHPHTHTLIPLDPVPSSSLQPAQLNSPPPFVCLASWPQNTMSNFNDLLSTFNTAIGTKPSKKNKKASTLSPTTSAPNPPSTSTLSQKQINAHITKKIYDISAIRSSLKPFSSTSSTSSSSSSIPQKINLAICAVIVDTFPHEQIWRDWSPSTTPTSQRSCSFHIHAKLPHSKNLTPWQKSHLLPANLTFAPEWNDVKVVRAMLALLNNALQDPTTTHTMFITESCIPISSFKDCYDAILNPNKDAIPPAHHISSLPSYNSTSPRFTKYDESIFHSLSQTNGFSNLQSIRKSLPGWVCLSRGDCTKILDSEREAFKIGCILCPGTGRIDAGYDPIVDPDCKPYGLWPSFTNTWAPEELYFPTILALTSPTSSKDATHPSQRSLTFCHWNHLAKNHKDRANPIWQTLSSESIVVWKEGGAVFARKFRGGVEGWREIVLASSEETGEVEMVRVKRKRSRSRSPP